jgi:hypothetical protein
MFAQRVLHAAILAVIVGAVAPQAQTRPDLSGGWVLVRDRSSQTMSGSTVVSVAGLLGESFTAKQDAATLSFDIRVPGLPRPIAAVYALDGSESRNMNPGAGPGGVDEPILSRASWDGDKLVILTRGTALVNGKPVESRRVIWIDAAGLLTIERSSEGASTTRSVYRRSQAVDR